MNTVRSDTISVSSLNTRPRLNAAIAIAVVGVSLANAAGGFLQMLFYLVCLLSWLVSPRPLPKLDTALLSIGVIYLAAVKVLSELPLDFLYMGAIIRPFIEGYLIASLLFNYCRINTLNLFASVLAGYIAFQVLFAVAMFIYPTMRDSVIEYIYRDESYGFSAFASAMTFRGFGISAHHLFGFSLAVGVASTIVALRSLEDSNLRHLAFFGLVVLGGVLTLINARIGAVPLLVTYVLGVSMFFNWRFFFQLIGISFIVVPILVYSGAIYFGEYLNFIIDWILAGASFEEGSSGHYLAEMLFLPENFFGVLFGTGSICSPDDSCYSDSGWVRLIFEGGLIYTALVTLLFAAIHQRIFEFARYSGHSRSQALFLVLILGITFVAATVKGAAYMSNDYSRLLVTLGYLGMFVAVKECPTENQIEV